MNTALIKNIKASFDIAPIMVFSPGRLNIIGEHTDYNNGFVLPAAIDKGIVCGIQKSNNNYCTITALDLKETFTLHLDRVAAITNGSWRNYIIGVVAEIQKKNKTLESFDLVFGGDIPEGAGLSSSAALENSVVFSLNELFNLQLSKEEMIHISQKAEHNYVGVHCGIMDQYASMYGKANQVILLDCENLNARYYDIDFQEYEILLINSNIKHSLAESAYNQRRETCEKVADALKVTSLRKANEEQLDTIKSTISQDSYEKALYVIQENNRVLEAANAIENNDLETLGTLLFESHKGLESLYDVSCKELDFLVKEAKLSEDVIGARMMGGGFGGCTINIIRKGKAKSFVETVLKSYNELFSKKLSWYHVSLSNGTHLIS